MNNQNPTCPKCGNTVIAERFWTLRLAPLSSTKGDIEIKEPSVDGEETMIDQQGDRQCLSCDHIWFSEPDQEEAETSGVQVGKYLIENLKNTTSPVSRIIDGESGEVVINRVPTEQAFDIAKLVISLDERVEKLITLIRKEI